MYLTVVAIASLLVLSFNLQTNMNSNMNANAFNFGLKSEDVNSGSIDTDSLFSCVGAAIQCINTNQENNNVVANNTATNNGNNGGNGGGNTPLPDDFVCTDECFAQFSQTELNAVAVALGVQLGPNENASLTDICLAIEAIGTVEALILALDEAGLSVTTIVELLTCLDIEITALEVTAIIG